MSAPVAMFLMDGNSTMKMSTCLLIIRNVSIFSGWCRPTVNTKFDTTDSITGQKLAEWLDDYSKTIDKVTFVVLDNASIHRKGEVAGMRDEWKKRGLRIFYLPTYSPHLNIAETVWRFLKGMWLKPHHYCSKSKLHEATREILDGIGKDYVINFSQAA